MRTTLLLTLVLIFVACEKQPLVIDENEKQVILYNSDTIINDTISGQFIPVKECTVYLLVNPGYIKRNVGISHVNIYNENYEVAQFDFLDDTSLVFEMDMNIKYTFEVFGSEDYQFNFDYLDRSYTKWHISITSPLEIIATKHKLKLVP